MTIPQHHAQLLDMDSHLALEILRQHLAFEVELLQPIFQVHHTLKKAKGVVSGRRQNQTRKHRSHTPVDCSVAVSK